MINYWWVTRPKRQLNSIPEILSVINDRLVNTCWQGQTNTQLAFEGALETSNLKRTGDRRDQRGGGARTYIAWLKSLGLLFEQNQTGVLKLTLAGEAVLAGEPPVEIITDQIFKYQFPSSFSLANNSKNRVHERFRIRPFRFLFRLLLDDRIAYLSEDEIAKVILLQAENESEKCYQQIVENLLDYRSSGEKALPDFVKESLRAEKIPTRLKEVANTIMNWVEYTQLARRDGSKNLRIQSDKQAEAEKILSTHQSFIDRPEEHEYFQRKYGVTKKRTKDTRNLLDSAPVTEKQLRESKIRMALFSESLRRPIIRITADLVDRICSMTGYRPEDVESVVSKFNLQGAMDNFMSEYIDMASKGRDKAVDFEKATAELFIHVFQMKALHTGPFGNTPDVYVWPDDDSFAGIIDNKAYREYSVCNDHKNRMLHNYIPAYSEDKQGRSLSFFSYIAGGFGSNINGQLNEITKASGVSGSAVTAFNIVALARAYSEKKYTSAKIKELFSLNRQILLSDF